MGSERKCTQENEKLLFLALKLAFAFSLALGWFTMVGKYEGYLNLMCSDSECLFH